MKKIMLATRPSHHIQPCTILHNHHQGFAILTIKLVEKTLTPRAFFPKEKLDIRVTSVAIWHNIKIDWSGGKDISIVSQDAEASERKGDYHRCWVGVRHPAKHNGKTVIRPGQCISKLIKNLVTFFNQRKCYLCPTIFEFIVHLSIRQSGILDTFVY